MGNVIGIVFARAGYNVILRDVQESFVQRGMEAIGKNLDREVKKGKLTEAEKPQVLARLKPVTDFAAGAAAGFFGEAGAGENENKQDVPAADGKLHGPGEDVYGNNSFDCLYPPAARAEQAGQGCG